MEGLSSDAGNTRFIRESGMAAQFAQLCEPVLDEMGFRLVRVALSGSDNTTVQIMAERPDGSISIKECADISRALSPLFDAHDPIASSYFLEVSSPGIDRPLVRPSDFEVWAGQTAKIELKELLEGRKRFRGVLEGFEDGEVRIEVELDQIGRTILGLPLNLIAEARLVLTDKLVREALNRQKTAAKDNLESGEGGDSGDNSAGSDGDNQDGDGDSQDGDGDSQDSNRDGDSQGGDKNGDPHLDQNTD